MRVGLRVWGSRTLHNLPKWDAVIRAGFKMWCGDPEAMLVCCYYNGMI